MKYVVRVIIGEYVDYANFDNEASAKEYAKRMETKKTQMLKSLKSKSTRRTGNALNP